MPRRLSPYERAKNESLAMRGRNESASVCMLDTPHNPHVLIKHRMAGSKDVVPCGGGRKRVDKHADRSVWDNTRMTR